jgi:hypothetical protein
MLKQVIEVMELLDSALVSGDSVRKFLRPSLGRREAQISSRSRCMGPKGRLEEVRLKP